MPRAPQRTYDSMLTLMAAAVMADGPLDLMIDFTLDSCSVESPPDDPQFRPVTTTGQCVSGFVGDFSSQMVLFDACNASNITTLECSDSACQDCNSTVSFLNTTGPAPCYASSSLGSMRITSCTAAQNFTYGAQPSVVVGTEEYEGSGNCINMTKLGQNAFVTERCFQSLSVLSKSGHSFYRYRCDDDAYYKVYCSDSACANCDEGVERLPNLNECIRSADGTAYSARVTSCNVAPLPPHPVPALDFAITNQLGFTYAMANGACFEDLSFYYSLSRPRLTLANCTAEHLFVDACDENNVHCKPSDVMHRNHSNASSVVYQSLATNNMFTLRACQPAGESSPQPNQPRLIINVSDYDSSNNCTGALAGTTNLTTETCMSNGDNTSFFVRMATCTDHLLSQYDCNSLNCTNCTKRRVVFVNSNQCMYTSRPSDSPGSSQITHCAVLNIAQDGGKSNEGLIVAIVAAVFCVALVRCQWGNKAQGHAGDDTSINGFHWRLKPQVPPRDRQWVFRS